MPKEAGEAEVPVSSDDIMAFAGRLADWGESLPPAEHSLAQALVQYTRDLRPEDINRSQFVAALAEKTRAAIASITEQWNTAAEGGSWLEQGPIWLKRAARAGREESEIVQWIYHRPERWTPAYE